MFHPFSCVIALCQAEVLALLLKPLDKVVKKFYGGVRSKGKLIEDNTVGALVCTIEKANMIFTVMMEEHSLSKLGALIIDELHLLGCPSRGFLLELLCTKLRFSTATATVQDTVEDVTEIREGVQVIGMSATLSNIKEVADWLGAKYFETDFRPAPLSEHILDKCRLLDRNLNCVRVLQYPNAAWAQSDPEGIALLAKETTDAGHSILVFCPSRAVCEWVAEMICRHLGELPEKPSKERADTAAAAAAAAALAAIEADLQGLPAPPAHTPNTRAAIMDQLIQVPGSGSNSGPHPILVNIMPKGVAFHHAGLSQEERAVVEAGYVGGAVRVLVCTPTMAMGVNLPARRVVFYRPFIPHPSSPITPSQYRQMAGRAGRAGIDEAGEVILMALPRQPYTASSLVKLITEPVPPITTCLVEGERGMTRALLEVSKTWKKLDMVMK
ncbi:P-loop containing nucleoside triphosphate hydrolase protein [Dunaliella salina]|uniref:P-loop containing nucleoside triphosphate hydrolase protein n=1 Tax=Dunaliella salina TaxID=3046 RepID=A0ABQ7FUJ7_DUNSA|nr:P-loop containing nucleoside triphosphate hydrolase protein [Dunaliella salina]|eukprot:KAF5826086.1 P-loop containing nucleoside triphosphate hydrolase protein [Dunaliella salina]